MSAISPKIGYLNQGATAGVQVKTGPAGFFGLVCTLVGGAVTVYDGTSTGGVILYTKTMAVGDVVSFGEWGIAAKNGLFIVVTGATVNVMFS
jgi:hypothetical protein